jgi:outer membrane protein TolC
MAFLILLAVNVSFGMAKELNVAEAVQLALANHPDIKQAELQVSLAELQLASAQAKAFLPTLSLSVLPSTGTLPQANLSATLSFPVGTSNKVVGNFSIQPSQNWSCLWSVNFSLSLDLANPMAAGESLSNLAQALEDTRASLENAKTTVVINVIKGYFDLLSLKAKADQAGETKAEAEKNLKAIGEKVASGLAGDLDLLEAKLSLVQAELDYQQSQASYQAQKSRFLRDYLGLEEDVELAPVSLDKDKLSSAAKKLLDSLNIDEAIETSREVKAAQAKVEEARKSLNQTKLSWLPTLSLEIGANPEGFKLGWALQFDLFSPDYASRVHLGEVQLALAELNLQTARATVRQRILDQSAALLSALQALDRLSLEEEEWNLKEQINRSKYEAGLLSESDWFQFQRDKEAFVLEAQQRLASVLLAYLNLQAALGGPVDWEVWWK